MEEILNLVKVFFISLSPFEMKAGIPIAILNYELDPIASYLVCTTANILSFQVVLFFINTVHKQFLPNRKYKQFCIKFAKMAKKKTAKLVSSYGISGLFLFVVIPLPMTGAYAGTVTAWLLNMNKRLAFIAVGCGVMIGALLVTFFTLMAQRGVFHTIG